MDCTKCGTAVLTTALVREGRGSLRRATAPTPGTSGRSRSSCPKACACPSCGGTAFERESNILDVWFDSGSSHEAVLPFREDHRWPADIYLEGSDQHRGWFHSSLLVGVGTRGRAPFDQVLTHGFVVDEHGRKMSKSLGNIIAPQDVIKQSGAEILRLWVSMVDYREDIRLGKEILARTVEAYRKFRNVIRVLVANLYDFDPGHRRRAATPSCSRSTAGCWRKYAECAEKIVTAYDDYDYPGIFQAANTFITVDLSAFYVDVTKDRMYTFGATSRGAPLRADGDVHRRRRPGAPAGADPVGDDGRAVADAAGRARAPRCTWRCSRGRRGGGPSQPRAARTLGSDWPSSATR